MQITGCLDPSKLPLSPTDDGGQFDVRFPDGAQCTFGGYGASFIEQYVLMMSPEKLMSSLPTQMNK